MVVDGGGVVVRSGKRGQRGDIAIGAIGIFRQHGERNADVFALEHQFGWFERDGGGVGDFGIVIDERALADPFEHDFVGGAAFFKQLAPGVRHIAHGFGDEQGFLGQGEIDAASGELMGDAEMIAVRIEAIQRELEAILAAGSAVAGTGIATSGGQHGHDIELEGNFACDVGLFDGDGNLAGLSTVGDDQLGAAILEWRECGFLELRERGIGEGEFRLQGDVARGGIVEMGDDDDFVEIVFGFERDGFGKCLDALDGGVGGGIMARHGLRIGGAKRQPLRPRCSGLDPVGELFDFLGGEWFAFFGGRHDVVIVVRQSHAQKNFRLIGLFQIDGRPAIAAAENLGARAHIELALVFLGVMATETFSLQQILGQIGGLQSEGKTEKNEQSF